MSHLSTLILAGGKSSRMGSDKAFLPWGNTTFLEQIITAVLPLSSEIYLSGNHARLHEFNFPVIEDKMQDAGPVVALASCFPQINSNLVLVLSCDVPQIRTQDLQILIKAHNSTFDVTLFSVNNQEMPLVAVYSKSSFNAFAEALKSGERKLFAVLKKLKLQTLAFTGKQGLKNINTKEDLENVLKGNRNNVDLND